MFLDIDLVVEDEQIIKLVVWILSEVCWSRGVCLDLGRDPNNRRRSSKVPSSAACGVDCLLVSSLSFFVGVQLPLPKIMAGCKCIDWLSVSQVCLSRLS
jgi:hypothetical protein